MKNLNSGARGSGMGSRFRPTGLLRYPLVFLICLLVGAGGVKLTVGSHAATPHYGYIQVQTTDGIGGPSLASVAVSINWVGGSTHVCAPYYGGSSVTSATGSLTLQCSLATGGAPTYPITYAITQAARGGYSVSPNSAKQIGTQIPLSSGWTLGNPYPVTIAMKQNAVAPAPTPTPTPAPAPTPTPQGGADGTVAFTVTDTSGKPLNGVVVKITPKSGGSCVSLNGVQWTDNTASNGLVRFTCQTASNSVASRDYYLSSVTKAGYTLSGSTPHPTLPDAFTVNPAKTTTYTIILKANAVLPTGGSPTSPSAPSKPTGSTTAPVAGSTAPTAAAGTSAGTTAVQASQKNGTVEVTTYVYSTTGLTRLAGVKVHIQANGYATTDTINNCTNYDQTTDGSKTAATNSGYGQVNFADCWTGVGGNAPYHLSYVQLPAGLVFKSFRATSGKFTDGATVSQGNLQKDFTVAARQTTKLEIVLSRNLPDSQSSDIMQVLTQKGTRYISTAPAPTTDNTTTVDDLNDLDQPVAAVVQQDAPVVSGDDMNPPSTPTNLKAVQDRSGAVHLSWEASTGDPVGEHITYDIARGVKSSSEGPEEVDSATSLSYVDHSDGSGDDGVDALQYPQTYTYYVSAWDDSLNQSEGAATVDFTTQPLRANVAAAPAPTVNVQVTPQPTVISSPDGSSQTSIPATATTKPLACADNYQPTAANDSDGGDPQLNDLGTAVATTGISCRDSSGAVVQLFSVPVTQSISVSSSADNGNTKLYAYDGTDWQQVPTGSSDDPVDISASLEQEGKSSLGYVSAKRTTSSGKTTYTVTTKKPLRLALVKQRANVPNPTAPIATLLLVAGAFLVARMAVRRRLAAQFSSIPYGDVDLVSMQMLGSAVQPPTPPDKPEDHRE